MKEIEKLHIRPFTRFCMSIGAVPSSYLAGLTIEEQLLWLCSYLEKEVVPVVNNNSEVVEELKNYVEHYFDNLDVQEEINNKLDEMAESGDLQDIISAYLNIRTMLCFDNVSLMIASENLENGSFARTLGYHSKNDGGGAIYKIRTKGQDNTDGMFLIQMNESILAAELIYENDVNLKQLGAYGDGVHDDSSYFNRGIEVLAQNKTTTDFSKINTLLIPGGEYKIDNTINLSVYVKLKTIGYATLRSYVDDICLKLSPDGVPYFPGESFERYNYLFGKLIDGEQGLRIVNMLSEEGNTIALSIGNNNVSDTTLNYNVSKASFDYISVNNFHIALKINPYNVYLNTFNHFYSEQNDYAIVVGDSNIANYIDAGENISFNNSIFAGSDVVCLYNTPSQSIDFNFNECSFDFNKCVFQSPNNNEASSPARKMSITNSHFEDISYLVDDETTPHGILFGQFRAYQITISNSRILQKNKYHLFYATSPTSYVLNLISNIITVYGDTDASNPYYQYFANDNVLNIHLFNNECSTRTGINMRLPSYNNCVIRPDWRSVDAGTTYTLTKNTANGTTMIDWKNAYFNKVNNTATVVANDFGGKSLQLKVDTSNPWDSSGASGAIAWQMLSKRFKAESGDVLGFSMIYKNMKITGSITFVLLCYDCDDNLISQQNTTTPQVINQNYVVTTLPRFLQCPVGTQSAEVRMALTQNNNAGQVQGEGFEIGNISVIKM